MHLPNRRIVAAAAAMAAFFGMVLSAHAAPTKFTPDPVFAAEFTLAYNEYNTVNDKVVGVGCVSYKATNAGTKYNFESCILHETRTNVYIVTIIDKDVFKRLRQEDPIVAVLGAHKVTKKWYTRAYAKWKSSLPKGGTA